MIHADNVVGFKLVRYRAVARAGHHGGERIAMFYKILGADGVEKALSDGDLTKLNSVAGRVGRH